MTELALIVGGVATLGWLLIIADVLARGANPDRGGRTRWRVEIVPQCGSACRSCGVPASDAVEVRVARESGERLAVGSVSVSDERFDERLGELRAVAEERASALDSFTRG